MKITRIVRQTRQNGRYSLFVDGTYAFALGDSALLASKLAVGQELSETELRRWRQESANDKVASLAVRYAALRSRSRWEVEQYLKRTHASPALIDKTLNKLSNIDLLNDEAFAKAWVANRHLLRPTSRRKLQQELRTKHIPDEVIEQAFAEMEPGDERYALRELVAKKRTLPKYKANPLKLMQYLARQGFSYEDVQFVLKNGDD